MGKMRFIFITWFVLVLAPNIVAQDNAANKDLLNEAKTKIYADPYQAGKISEYIINKNDEANTTAEATLILAQSFYVRGNFSETVTNALQARKLANATDDTELKLESNLFAIRILRELGLKTVANRYLDQLVNSKNKIQSKSLYTFLDGKLVQDSAYVNFLSGETQKAEHQLEEAKSIFYNMNDSLSAFEAEMDLAILYLKAGEIDLARQGVENQMDFILKHKAFQFQRLIALNTLGQTYFADKEYQKSLEAYATASTISSEFPNPFYEKRSAEGLAKNYLALGDKENFYAFEKKANSSRSSVKVDENLAVSSAYNFINAFEKEKSEAKEAHGYLIVYVLIGAFVLLMLTGIILTWLYSTAIKRYKALSKYILPQNETKKEPVQKELEKSSTVPEEIEQVLLQKLKKFEAGTKYTAQDMSIALLAASMDTNTKYLSEVINRHKGKHFNSYINELRINYIIEKLKSQPVYFNYKISYLADECGFSSHSAFTKVFKSVTGISPTAFMALFQKENQIGHKMVAVH